MNWLDGTGFLLGDIALTVLLLLASVASWWNIALRGHTFGGWFLAVGFTTQLVRMVYSFIIGADPPISPPGLIALSLIASGWTLVALRKRKPCSS